ncbi:hypothetical protein CONPUDRAFT_77054 [Coniophora puteana RWD-64-598 SS2]|uniref:Uncharacterized protein n=1 Tax=Coniophora puteana (strain RWD-64-598) TaxID=741705 RepID=A0A5M3MBN2_CONPW|nr:uncharacterized protein CONPUDRAFT_77054 [Coniophora puteana RWD-64-598 SS2]EIW76041.1 hypothetical protein CONPUDRAFT_77054 [Coniophora puteana RWD-64-598 SS2]
MPTYDPPDTFQLISDSPLLQKEIPKQPTFDLLDRLGKPQPADLNSAEVMAPFSSPSAGILMAYGEAGTGQKSESDLKWLGSVLIQHPLFKPEELSGFDPAAEKCHLDRFLQTKDNAFRKEHGWYKSSLEILLPFKGHARVGGKDNAPKLTVDFFH